MTDKLLRDALILWATIDPVGTLAIFASLTGHLSDAERRRTAIKAIAYAAAILVGAVIIGQFLLSAMGIRLVSLQVAGGIILFLFGLKMVFGTPLTQGNAQGEPGHDIAVFPLAGPSIATPGALMAVIILTDNHTYPIQVQLATTGVMLAVLLATFVFMLAAGHIIRVIGHNGSAILVRVMGMLLAALSIELVMEALNIFDLLATSTN